MVAFDGGERGKQKSSMNVGGMVAIFHTILGSISIYIRSINISFFITQLLVRIIFPLFLCVTGFNCEIIYNNTFTFIINKAAFSSVL